MSSATFRGGQLQQCALIHLKVTTTATLGLEEDNLEPAVGDEELKRDEDRKEVMKIRVPKPRNYEERRRIFWGGRGYIF